ncbi:hypothetical protein [Rhizobium halophytocola]|uniref:Mg2+ and Co2+ transporter CorA n=1 Tax=Rhizobium halophytocola TaxID=735519 RepID=A0ABS4E612_9HYPH|nr:hypothetical protein [Rhizobium halophytocola]MBP1853392.1 Mg2+ and Co2+ transporter CorA [Rhizobium halophytocola]
MEGVTLEFLARQVKGNLDEMRLMRKDLGKMMRLMTANYELSRRLERRQDEMRDDIELMAKMELGGSFAHVRTVMEASLGRIEDTLGNLQGRVEGR